MTGFRIDSDLKTGKRIITCQCGERIEYSLKLKKCPLCKIKLPTQQNHFGRLIDLFMDPPRIKFSTEEITQWLQRVHEKEKLTWKDEETTNILLAALQEEDLEIRKQAFLLIKRIPKKLQLLARFRWEIMDGLENLDVTFRLIALEIVQKWPYKQRRDPRIQKRVKALQNNENPEVQRLVEIILKNGNVEEPWG